jgi:hypothetical protein
MPAPNKLNPPPPCEKWYMSKNRVANVTNMRRKVPYILIKFGIIEQASLKTPNTHKARYRLKIKQMKL